MSARTDVEKIASSIGVTVNGSAPTDPQIYDDRMYSIFLSRNSLVMGESFMDKWWDCEDLAGFYAKALAKRVSVTKMFLSHPAFFLRGILSNLQSRARAFHVGEQHYDLGNDLYQAMLDKRMVYTCALWGSTKTLEAAQEQKLERLCQKMELKPGDRVLDIGCGWGSFMKYAAEKYKVSCVGLSVSKEQTALGRELCKGLPIEFVITDYRDYQDESGFDHIVSIEMIEAVGPKNFRTYFEKAHELLRPKGTFALQGIIDLHAKPVADPWLHKYIFPNGVLPSLRQLEEATREFFLFVDLKDIGADYDPTLMEWWLRLEAAYPKLQVAHPEYDERHLRMWKYYLQSCAALFRARAAQDYQLILERRAS